MKSAEQIEQAMRRLSVQPDSERRAQGLRDVIEAHTRQKKERPAVGRRRFGRIIMVHITEKVAAIFALAVVLVGGLSWGTGSVAFSEARHAVNSTLAWLRQAVVGSRPGEPEVEAPRLPVVSAPDDNSSAIMYAARVFRVPEDGANLWQILQDQGHRIRRGVHRPGSTLRGALPGARGIVRRPGDAAMPFRASRHCSCGRPCDLGHNRLPATERTARVRLGAATNDVKRRQGSPVHDFLPRWP